MNMNMVSSTLVEISEYTGEGYQPLVDYASWRVAVMRDSEPYAPDRIDQVEAHQATDEVFVLLAGKCTLFICGDPGTEPLQPVRMEPLKLYNIKRGVWHTLRFSPDASVLIVENRDTSVENSKYASLTPDQRELVRQVQL